MLYDIITTAEKKLYYKIQQDEISWFDELQEAVYDVATESVPGNNNDIFHLASFNRFIGSNIPQWCVFNGNEPTPVNLMATNLYECIVNSLREYIRDCEELQHLVE